MGFLAELLIFLLAAVIAVPISCKLGFGSVLGYLAAGAARAKIFVLAVSDPEQSIRAAFMPGREELITSPRRRPIP